MNDIKTLNDIEKKIYKSILSSEKLKKDLMNDFNLPKTTANRVLQKLLDKNLIIEKGLDLSSGGRPPIIYAASSDNFYTVGIDISRSYFELILLDSSLQVIFKERFKMGKTSTPKSTIEVLYKSFEKALSTVKIEKSKILGIAVGVVEPFNFETGFLGPITNMLNNDWNKVDIISHLNKYFDLPILIDKGTNMAAFGEYFININKKIKKIIYINLGLGIRYGLVDDGKIVNSFNPIYDALAHMTIESRGKDCPCGKKGCLELYGTITSIEDNFKDLTNKNLNIDKIYSLLSSNDINALKSFEETAFYLALGINNLLNLTNPNKIIINGPLIQKSPFIFNKILENIISLNHNSSKIKEIFSTTSLFGESLISIGAAISFIDNYIN
ncbi:MAG: ROK family protein [Sarcina sp.]